MSRDMPLQTTHFYTVISSSHDTTIYHPLSHSSPFVLQPRCGFSPHHVIKACIEDHFQPSSTAPSPFITLFRSFADALTRAYYYYNDQNSATGVQILKLEFVDLQLGFRDDVGVFYYYSPGLGVQLLPMAEVGPMLHVNKSYIRPSEFLSCGPIQWSAVAAAWPVIGSKVFFEPGVGEDLVVLMGHVCGREMEGVDEQKGGAQSESLVYDWNSREFLVREGCEEGRGDSVVSGGVSHFRPMGTSLLRCEGFLRGTIVMD